MDTEWLALRAGIKPAIQRGASGGVEAAATAAHFAAQGMSVAHSDPATGRHIVYIASRQEDADALRDAEADLLLPEELPVEREVTALEEVGRRLGYPGCCVARRIERNRVRRACRDHEYVPHEDYRGAVDAWVEHPAWELNRFALPNETFLVTFEPCTYDCPAAIALARRVLDVVARDFSDLVQAFTEKLQRPFIVGREHERGAFAVLDRGGPRTIVSEAIPLFPAAADFAAGLRGLEVGPNGAVGDAVLLDFGA